MDRTHTHACVHARTYHDGVALIHAVGWKHSAGKEREALLYGKARGRFAGRKFR